MGDEFGASKLRLIGLGFVGSGAWLVGMRYKKRY